MITTNVLWRGSRPDKDGAAWLIQHGVKTIVNLELILDDKQAFNQATIENGNNYEVDYFRIYDWEPYRLVAPSIVDENVAHFLAIVSQQPKSIYVHCRYGENRTSVMIAAYRMIIEGVSTEVAIEEMRHYKGLWFTADENYIRGLSPQRLEEIRRKVIEWKPKFKMEAKVVCTNGRCTISDN